MTLGECDGAPPALDAQQIKQLLEGVSGGMHAKEKEARAWKVKYNIQTQQERELQRTQAEPARAGPGVLA